MEEIYKIELSDVGDDGSFACPRCGEIMSSEDKSGGAYVLESWAVGAGVEVVGVDIRCRCGSRIRLEGPDILEATGFPEYFGGPEDPDYELDRLETSDESPTPRPRSSIPFWD